jgi:hypothetical protein
LNNFYTESDELMGAFSATILQDNKTEVQTCHGDFCCQLVVETMSLIGEYFYQLVAFNGTNNDDIVVQACGLVACSSRDVASCADSINSAPCSNEVEFEYLKLTGNFRYYT